MYTSLGDYVKAREYLQKALAIRIEIGDRKGEASDYGNLGTVFHSLGEYAVAKEYIDKALAIKTNIGDRRGEASDYGNLAAVYTSLGDYVKAREYLQKALAIRIEIGDRKGEASDYGNLGTVFHSLGEYVKAQRYLNKALAIRTDIGDRRGEASDYGNLGTVFNSLGDYAKAKEYFQKALAITIEIGDRSGEATSYGNLGTLFNSLADNFKAEQCFEKAIAISVEIGDRGKEATFYGNLGATFNLIGENFKAKEYIQKAIAMKLEIGDRSGVAASYGNLAVMFSSLGQYVKAIEYQEKALAIRIEIGDRNGEAFSYGNLGTVFSSLGEHAKAKEYHEKAHAITTEIGHRAGEATDYGNLGTVFHSLGEYAKAIECQEKALAIRSEIGDRKGEAFCYGNLGTVYHSLGDILKAQDYCKNALAIRIEIGDREGQTADYINLGNIFRSLGDFKVAEECLEKGLSISRDVGCSRAEMKIHLGYALLQLSQDKIHDSLLSLHQCIEKYEMLRGHLGMNDQFKTSILEVSGAIPYAMFSVLLSVYGNPRDALYVEELGRARGLAELMAEKYSVETHTSADRQSWSGIENIMREETNSACLYISYFQNFVHLWVLKASGAIHFKRVSADKVFLQLGFAAGLTVSQFLVNSSFRQIGVLPAKDCEDRSLNVGEPQSISFKQENSTALRLMEEEDENFTEENTSLSLCYKIFVAPVVDLLEEPEVIIVPHRSLYKVPFAALSVEGTFLSETHRIRTIPSLTTLKLIQDSPVHYHSQTNALIVGDPKVGWVMFKGGIQYITSLPNARKEAEMIGRLMGVKPLLGEQATKQAVIEKITSVSLIHFAAHGDAERGEIALSPIRTPDSPDITPQEEDYLLTMAEISQVKVRAKLVVLSCCHSGSGQIKAEGIIGIARAFLGSGARSVLVALWAISDTATEQLMNRFYEHLARGDSASECLYQAMKWMRNNGYTNVSDWAPFILIGDDIMFDFGKLSLEK